MVKMQTDLEKEESIRSVFSGFSGVGFVDFENQPLNF